MGYPRVTHPFAAFRGPKALSSLDLHVLSAPPAFVLSQDQTLREKLSASAPKGGSLSVQGETCHGYTDPPATGLLVCAPRAEAHEAFSNALRC